jgi:hypothetical protein
MASTPLSPEPSVVVSNFWTSLRSSAHEEATETARRVLRDQAQVTEAFSFDLVEGEEGGGTGQPRESSLASVEPGTPRPVVQSWNQDKLVSLVLIRRDRICGAAIGNDITSAAADFKACLLPREGGEDVKCNAGTHVGARVKRMNPPTMDYLLAIPVPSSSDSPKQVFSRPVLQQADIFYLPLESEAYSKLMSHKLEPRVWKALFELFPGPHCLGTADAFEDIKPSPLFHPDPAASAQTTSGAGLREVSAAPIFTPRHDSEKPGETFQTPASQSSSINSSRAPRRDPSVPSVHGSASQQTWGSRFTSRASRSTSSAFSSSSSSSSARSSTSPVRSGLGIIGKN